MGQKQLDLKEYKLCEGQALSDYAITMLHCAVCLQNKTAK